jgi:copper chaperone CopZ
METTFTTPDIECAGCAASIEKALGREPGIKTVAVSVPAKTVTIGFEPSLTSRERLTETLTDIGFPPQKD